MLASEWLRRNRGTRIHTNFITKARRLKYNIINYCCASVTGTLLHATLATPVAQPECLAQLTSGCPKLALELHALLWLLHAKHGTVEGRSNDSGSVHKGSKQLFVACVVADSYYCFKHKKDSKKNHNQLSKKSTKAKKKEKQQKKPQLSTRMLQRVMVWNEEVAWSQFQTE